MCIHYDCLYDCSYQVFLRSGILPSLDQRVEAHTHNSMVLFQARCRGYLGRKRFKNLEVMDSAAYVIQSNVAVWMEIRDWSWWQLYTKVRMGVWQYGITYEWTYEVSVYVVWEYESVVCYSDQTTAGHLEGGEGDEGETVGD